VAGLYAITARTYAESVEQNLLIPIDLAVAHLSSC